jgi:glycosyltransferase involved in cell wall biosynthesis
MLNIFYGWEIWDYFYSHSVEARRWKERVVSLMNQPGISKKCVHIDLPELWAEYLSSGVWLYPTEWKENSCVCAMKAQACGVLPVTTSVAALDETVQWGRKIYTASIYTDACAQREFVDAVVEYLATPDELYRKSMVVWGSRTFSWEKVASEWQEEFKFQGISA